MTLAVANNIDDYLSDACHTDGIMFMRMTVEDATVLEQLCQKYNKQTRRYRENEDLDIPASLAELEDTPTVDEIKKTKSKVAKTEKVKVKKMWVHKGSELKRIPEDERVKYMQEGWKIGKADK